MITPALSPLDRTDILNALQIPERSEAACQDPGFYNKLDIQIAECEKEVLHFSSPRAVYRILPAEELEPVIIGNDIRRLLDGCSEAVMVALTLGARLERHMMTEEVRDMSKAYILDVCASLAVERAADSFEDSLRSSLLPQGKYLTNRYSPGYGDLPLSIQKTLLDMLNAQRAIGLTLTPTGLMVPRKSITAVLGVSDNPKPDVHGGCGSCPLLTKCSWREHGKHCYS
ncbi:MAG: hypothetical protein J6E32_03325 [Lachnospiraceae bacterium]|nr:hypothetical protein [Lachnospiraceae bacterium]